MKEPGRQERGRERRYVGKSDRPDVGKGETCRMSKKVRQAGCWRQAKCRKG